jgi:Sulfotransferase family
VSSVETQPIIVIGRGQSGTRVLSHTLYASGVNMGRFINLAGDKVPAEKLYEACLTFARYVDWNGGLSWSFDRLQTMPLDPEFISQVEAYVHDVVEAKNPRKGWKLPETTLIYPWIVRMFPQAKYLYIVRDPRDCLLRGHITDDLSRWKVPCPDSDYPIEQRVASWTYQRQVVKATPTPDRFLSIRYEDLVLDQDSALRRMEGFLGFPLARIVVNSNGVGRWQSDPSVLPHLEPVVEEMRELGYDDRAGSKL